MRKTLQLMKKRMKKLLIRTLAAAVFAFLTFFCLLSGKYFFAAYMLFIMCGMMLEFLRIADADRHRAVTALCLATAVVFFAALFAIYAFDLPAALAGITVFPLILLMSSSIFLKDKEDFKTYPVYLTALLYLAVPVSLSNVLVLGGGEFRGALLLCFFIIVWCTDVGAYLTGMALGQKYGGKLCPEISPKKSWIGFWGSIFFAGFGAFLLNRFGMWDVPALQSIVIGIIMAVAGTAGDLFESMWKRRGGVKDSGNLIPGHGGLLDRFDSSLFAIPAGAASLAIINLL